MIDSYLLYLFAGHTSEYSCLMEGDAFEMACVQLHSSCGTVPSYSICLILDAVCFLQLRFHVIRGLYACKDNNFLRDLCRALQMPWRMQRIRCHWLSTLEYPGSRRHCFCQMRRRVLSRYNTARVDVRADRW